jgi:hypothetical protein
MSKKTDPWCVRLQGIVRITIIPCGCLSIRITSLDVYADFSFLERGSVAITFNVMLSRNLSTTW